MGGFSISKRSNASIGMEKQIISERQKKNKIKMRRNVLKILLGGLRVMEKLKLRRRDEIFLNYE